MGIIRPLIIFTLIILNVHKAALQDNDTRKVTFVNVVGKNETFILGQWLRRRYDALLTDRYSPEIIYVQSTDDDRTLMSAECVLAGMYPPAGVQEWSKDLDWQPIPVHTTPLNKDTVFLEPSVDPCPVYNKEFHRVFTSDERVRVWNQTYSELLRWTSEHAGANYALDAIYSIYDALLIETLYDLKLPEWTKKVFPEPMRAANVDCFRLETMTTTLIRLRTGLLLHDMIKHMKDKVDSKTTRNIHVYSAHDINIGFLMTALGVFFNVMPRYATCIMLELHRDARNGYYVSVFYHNSTSKEDPYLLTVKGCSPQCPLDKFLALSQPFILNPDDWELECGLHKESSFPIVIIVIVILVILVAVNGAVAFLMWKRLAHSHWQPTSRTQETSQNTTNLSPTTESA